MSQLWNVALPVQTALGARFRPATESITKETGLGSSVWNLLPTALSYEPESISITQLQKRNPYTAAPTLEQPLEALKAKGFLSMNPHREYRLTEAGRVRAHSILKTMRAYHETVQPLALADMNRLAALLRRVVVDAEKAPTPPGTWCFTRARRLKPGNAANPTTEIDHYLACLNAFRDDAHLAALRVHSVSGPAWEAFTLIWHGEAKNADQLLQKLPWRGHSREIYAVALKQLSEKGWVAEKTGDYAVTESGKVLRDAAEATTDNYFDGAYSLTDMESNDLRGLLETCRGALTRQ